MSLSRRRVLLALPLPFVAGAGLLARDIDLLATVASGPVPAAPTRGSPSAVPVRGMTVSCPTWGWEWGSDAMVGTLEELRELGVNWVAIHPYAGIRDDGSLRVRGLDEDQPPDWLVRPIRECHRLGMQLLMKPHIAYWGSSFSWRGAIRLPEPERRARFFADYTRWIARLAEISAEADGFVVGTELDGLLDDEPAWRRVIAEVRARCPAHLTYAANWSDWERVAFWDALDAIGVQAYFPLLKAGEAGGDGGLPTDRQLDAGWERVLKPLRERSRATGKPVVFTELGYNRSAAAAHEPWAYETGGRGAEEIQVRCLEAALRVLEREPSVHGAFLWKWFPGGVVPRDFAMQRPELQALIRARWRA